MNERIRQLADHAKAYANQCTKDYDGDVSWYWMDYYTEKFAELIVEECADILMKPEYVMNHPEELTDYNRGWVNGRLLGIEHIKQHFGVEE